MFLVASCYKNRSKLRSAGPLGLYADFAFVTRFVPRATPECPVDGYSVMHTRKL